MVKDFLDEFLTVFGDVTIAEAVVYIAALIFMVLIYKKVSKHFKKQGADEKTELDADSQLKEDVKTCLEEVKKYPQYRQQSLDIQKQLTDSIDGVKDAVNEVSKMVDMNEIKRIRAEIFAFADSCKLGEKHTEDGFLHIIDIHDDYMALLEKYKMSNGRISADYEYIMSVYRELRDKGTFSERKV